MKKLTSWLDELDFALRAGRRSKVKPFTFKDQKAFVARTVGRAPETIVKVSGGGRSVKQVFNHLSYLTRNGKLEAITENYDRVSSRAEIRELVDEWDLENTRGFGRVKVAFNLIFSMPKNTDPKRLHQAVKEFAREQFWDKHQYIMVLHEDRDHPHVHICVKAMEKNQKTRLYIRKATLETWRQNFAKHLRDQGIEANATPRDLRGVTRKSKKISVYHAEKAGRSTVLASKIKEIAVAIQQGEQVKGAWTMAIAKRRVFITQLYQKAADELRHAGDKALAQAVETFAASLPPVITERDNLGAKLIRRVEENRARRDAEKTDVRDRQVKVSHDIAPIRQPVVKQQPIIPGHGEDGRER